MSTGSIVDKIRALLASEAYERQIAAAIVLGEIGVRDASVVEGLAGAVASGVPPVQRHALEALARLASGPAARKVLPRVVAALASRDEQVRRAAVGAAVAFGDAAVGEVRRRLGEATDAQERRALEEVLGRVGGKDATTALLAALDTPDIEAARAAALAVRQRVKEAGPRERAALAAQVTKLLSATANATRANREKKAASPALLAGALKILGYLEDPAAIPTLLAYARDARRPDPVREEAIVALRFVTRGKTGARLPATLLDLAERAPVHLARAALYTLAGLDTPPALAPRLRKLAIAGEAERALLALEQLARIPAPAAADALAGVLTSAQDRLRAEAAANALSARPDGPPALARALLSAPNPERAALLARLLRPRARALLDGGGGGRKLARALVDEAVARVGRGGAGADALLPLARELDREATGAGLRALAAKLGKRASGEQALAVLRLVGSAADATAGDGYALASAELRAGRHDEAITIVGQLLDRGFDLPAALRRDKTLSPENRYQVGFHLIERRHPAGEEILSVLAGDGRGKTAKMAKAKLKSAGYA